MKPPPPIDLQALPAELRAAVTLLSPVELAIVGWTQAGLAAHRIAEEIGWREHEVSGWRKLTGFVSTVEQRSEVTRAARALGARGGPQRRAPTFEELEPDYAGARYQNAGGEDFARWRPRATG